MNSNNPSPLATLTIPIHQLAHGKGLPLAKYASPGAAGLDLTAAIDAPLFLAPGARALVPTGIAIALPEGFEGQIRPRSGLALKHGVTILNAPGTIDSDYRGEIGIILINHGEQIFRIERGDRIAQMIIAPFIRATWCPANILTETTRGNGGFGSTGINNKELI